MIIVRRKDIKVGSKDKKLKKIKFEDFQLSPHTHIGQTVVFIADEGEAIASIVLKQKVDEIRKTRYPVMTVKEYNESIDQAKLDFAEKKLPMAIRTLQRRGINIYTHSEAFKEYFESIIEKYNAMYIKED